MERDLWIGLLGIAWEPPQQTLFPDLAVCTDIAVDGEGIDLLDLVVGCGFTGPMPQEVVDAIEGYVPRKITKRVWREVNALFQDVMKAARPNGVDAYKKMRTPVARFLSWGYVQGIPRDVESMFIPDNVDRFSDEIEAVEPTTAGTYRSTLRLVGQRVTRKAPWLPGPTAFPRKALAAPYNPKEMARLAVCIKAQSTELRRRTGQVTLVVCNATGITASELVVVEAPHFRFAGDVLVLDVAGARPRTVAVAAACVEAVQALCAAYPEGPLVGADRGARADLVSRRVEDFIFPTGTPRLSISRLRSTWLVDRLNEGVPVNVIMKAAGISSARFVEDLVAYLDPVEETLALEILRDGLL